MMLASTVCSITCSIVTYVVGENNNIDPSYVGHSSFLLLLLLHLLLFLFL